MKPARKHSKAAPKRPALSSSEPKPGAWISPEDFATVVRLTPLVAIDLIIRDPDERVLVGRRNFEPAKGVFFVPGGRITKNETREAALRRLTREEIGVELGLDRAVLLGVYDHLYRTNRFEAAGYGTHYVTLGYELRVPVQPESLPTDQHHEYRWLSPQEILDSPEVHDNTKAYFRAQPA
jgi:colanic acid biosynthesis protein WcaH